MLRTTATCTVQLSLDCRWLAERILLLLQGPQSMAPGNETMQHAPGRFIGRRPWIALLLVLFISSGLSACQVPVFRFALERWQADAYRLVILHRGREQKTQQQAVQSLLQLARENPRMQIRETTLSEGSPQLLHQLYESAQVDNGPVVAAFYPGRSGIPAGTTAVVLPVSAAGTQSLLRSPIQSQLIRRLAAGDSVVWLFLASGRPDRDVAARTLLTEQLEQLQRHLQLPAAEELQVQPSVLQKLKVPFELRFSVLDLPESGEQEHCLREILLNSEPDLRGLEEPIVFPVFGRGRVLYALAGAGINAGTIRAATEFLTGPCSCQVKEENPGFDLPLNHDWEQSLGEVLLSSPVPERSRAPVTLPIPPGRDRKGAAAKSR